jgi:hypothetical protein
MPPSSESSRRRRAQITDGDRLLLAYLAEHRLARADQLQVLLGRGAAAVRARVRALVDAGLLSQEVYFHRQPPCLQITRQGLAAIGSPLPAPRVDLSTYAHDLGAAWLWLAARDGAFGPLREVIAERTLRSRDRPSRRSTPPLAIGLGGVGPGGLERLHYPDLRLVTAAGRRVAVELELTSKGRRRRESILSAYGADPHVDTVLYLVPNRRVGGAILASARRLGIEDLIRVQSVRLPEAAGPGTPARTLQRAPRQRGAVLGR